MQQTSTRKNTSIDPNLVFFSSLLQSLEDCKLIRYFRCKFLVVSFFHFFFLFSKPKQKIEKRSINVYYKRNARDRVYPTVCVSFVIRISVVLFSPWFSSPRAPSFLLLYLLFFFFSYKESNRTIFTTIILGSWRSSLLEKYYTNSLHIVPNVDYLFVFVYVGKAVLYTVSYTRSLSNL